MLTQGSLLRLRFSVEDPPANINILSITASFIQSFHLQSIKNTKRRFQPAPSSIRVFSANFATLANPEFSFEPKELLNTSSTYGLVTVPAQKRFAFTFTGRASKDTRMSFYIFRYHGSPFLLRTATYNS